MRVRGKGESSSILGLERSVITITFCASVSQFRRFQTELEDELGDDVQVVSADQQIRKAHCLSSTSSFIYIRHPIQVGTSTPTITGYFEVEIGGNVVHSKKVT